MTASAASSFAPWLLLAWACGCSTSSELGPEGEYATERTVVVTGTGAPDRDGCGAPQAPQSGEAAFRYRVSASAGSVSVLDLVGGCILDAHSKDGVVIADGAECSFTANSQLRQLGVTSRTYSLFRLDPRSSTVRTRSLTQAVVVGGESRSCAVTEERIVEVPPSPVSELFHYSGSLLTTVEQPDSEPDCADQDVTFQASGYLSLDRGARLVRLEGFGCHVSLDEGAGTSLAGSSQPCVMDGAVGFEGFGLDALHFDSINVDAGDKTLNWRARAWRSLPSGRVSYCFNLTAELESR